MIKITTYYNEYELSTVYTAEFALLVQFSTAIAGVEREEGGVHELEGAFCRLQAGRGTQ